MEGVVHVPSAFSITFGRPFSMMATQELVVPELMPIIFLMLCPCLTPDDVNRYEPDVAVVTIGCLP